MKSLFPPFLFSRHPNDDDRIKYKIWRSFFFLILFISAAYAQIPRTISYQGVLTDTAGSPKPDGNYSFTFSLYESSKGGNIIWSETKTLIVTKGLFSTLLGDQTPFSDSLKFDKPYWLGIKVGNDAELSPRIALTSSGYSFSSIRSDTSNNIINGKVVKSLNGLKDDIKLIGDGGTSVTARGDTIMITSSTGSGGGIQEVDNTNATLDITNPKGSKTIINLKLPVASAIYSDTAKNIINGKTVKSLNGLKDDVQLQGGGGTTINTSGNKITISSSSSGGGIQGLQNSDGTIDITNPAGPKPTINLKVPLSLSGTINSGNSILSGINTSNGDAIAGKSTDGRGLYGLSSTAPGIYGESNKYFGIFGKSDGTNQDAIGVYGIGFYGVQGSSQTGTGVVGLSNTGYGVIGNSTNGTGVHGVSNSGNGVWGETKSGAGIYGQSTTGYGVHGSSPSDAGVWGESTSGSGVFASSSGGRGVFAESQNGAGIFGMSNTGYGVEASSQNDDGVYASSGKKYGVAGITSGAVAGTSYAGVYGSSTNHPDIYGVLGAGNTAVMGYSLNNYAGYFWGYVYVNGGFGHTGASKLKIDDPVDPANKYLVHSSVESSDQMDIYNGNVITDLNGSATVILPSYFQALNTDYKYQLTTIGQQAQAWIQDEIQNNSFTIKTDKPNVKVSWQVTGIRNDPYTKSHPILAEQNKEASARGKYIHPESYGQPKENGISYVKPPEIETGK